MKYLKLSINDLVFYFLVVLIIFIPTILPFFIHGYKTNLAGFLFLCTISFFVIIIIRIKGVWLLPLLFISFTYSIYILFTGEELGVHVIGSIFETNLAEAKELLLSPAVLMLIIISLFITSLTTFFLTKISKKTSTRIIKINLIFLLIAPLSIYSFSLILYQHGFRWNGVYPFNITNKVMKYQVVSKQSKLFRKNMDNFVLEKVSQPINKNEITVVFVIGEAARIHSMSLYGYHLDTTPNFKKLNKTLGGKRFYTFSNVLPAAPFTRVSVPSMLSLSGVRSFTSIHQYPSFIKIFSALGFETYLISGQPSKGFNNNLTEAFFADIKQRIYLNKVNTPTNYDSEIIPFYKDYITGSPKQKLILVHLSGSHIDYKYRYPENHNFFKGSTLRNTYDNSIRYTDHILKRLINQLEKLETPAVLVYCSDHGENLNDSLDNNYGHGSKDFTKFELQIPLNIWVNNKYVFRHSTQLANLANHQERLISHDNISHTLLGIADLYPNGYKSNMDISSPNFKENNRYVMDRDSNIFKAKDILPWLISELNQ